MGKHSCCYKQKLKKGLWSPEEDEKLLKHVTKHGHGCWSSVPKLAGLQRCGKSCRLRWINYLRPDLKRGSFSQEEEDLIIQLHSALGNKWSQIAAKLPGRTDNEIKNFWNSCIKKKLRQQGIDPDTHSASFAGGADGAEEKSSGDGERFLPAAAAAAAATEIPIEASAANFAFGDEFLGQLPVSQLTLPVFQPEYQSLDPGGSGLYDGGGLYPWPPEPAPKEGKQEAKTAEESEDLKWSEYINGLISVPTSNSASHGSCWDFHAFPSSFGNF